MTNYIYPIRVRIWDIAWRLAQLYWEIHDVWLIGPYLAAPVWFLYDKLEDFYYHLAVNEGAFNNAIDRAFRSLNMENIGGEWSGRYRHLWFFFSDPTHWMRDFLETYVHPLYLVWADPDSFFRDEFGGRLYTLYYLYTDPGGWFTSFINIYLPEVRNIITDPGGWIRGKIHDYFPALYILETDPDRLFREWFNGRLYTLYYLYTDPGGWWNTFLTSYTPELHTFLQDPRGYVGRAFQGWIDDNLDSLASWLANTGERVLSAVWGEE